jgi:hypothetical protein
MKDMIYRYDHNEDYRKNKVKFPSLPSMVRFKKVIDYIGDDFSPINCMDLKENLNLKSQ